MIKRKIFVKKKSFNKFFLFICFLFISIIFFSWVYFVNINNNNFLVEENNRDYYFLFKENKCKNTSNANIKILNPKINTDFKNILIDNNLKYSIQIFSSFDYECVIEKLEIFSNKLTFNQDDFSIIAFNHNIGNDYLLLYKNFNNREEAIEYCSKYLTFIDDCLIVNAQNLD